ncbi:MAG: hypothetical protein KatS3mg043_1937 [Rhodothermaceae bacterium]|nr:MAG: hypothetical protein KatS3mg043_1937 [Rhodothermaceae bacterium]
MVPAIAHESEPCAVGRPAELARTSPAFEELLRLRFTVVERDGPDLPATEEGQGTTIGRDGRGLSLGQPLRGAACHRDDPDLLFCAVGMTCRVRVFSLPVRVAPAYVDDPLALRGEDQVAERLAVVLGVRRHRPAPEIRPVGHPEVAHAFGIEHPGHTRPHGRGHQVRRKRRAEHLLDGEGLPGLRDDHRQNGHKA